ncbi:MAG: acyl-CoA thioesterase [Anaerolineales bacterium]|nr:acyl-CoA thioesterase [Anaerolineales bacterium]
MSKSEPLAPQPVSASRVIMSQLMNPTAANIQGNVHGGHIMKLVDETGALACMRHAHKRVVTVAIDRMTFQHPIRIGDLVTLTGEVSYVGSSSMEVEVSVFAENPTTGEKWHTNTAYLVYVALDENGKPARVPPLQPETEFERKRMELGAARQAYRLSQSRQTESLRSNNA